MRIHHVIAAAAIVATSSNALAATDYGATGPEPVAVSDLPANAGGSVGGKLVVPGGAGPYPLMVVSHGFSANADNQVGWAKHFASYGFVVVVPSLPNTYSPDVAKNAAVIKALVTMYSTPPAGSPAAGKVDPRRIALEGYSAGGLSTAVASRELRPLATVLFDPVDKDDLGKTAMPGLCGPLMEIFTAPSTCNATGNWTAFKATSSGPTTLFKIAGANHCDGENTARALCGFAGCGGTADAGRQTTFARYATAFLLAHVKGDAAADAAVNDATLRADPKLTEVAVTSAASCVTAPGSGSTGGGTTGGTTGGGTTGTGGTTSGGGGTSGATTGTGGTTSGGGGTTAAGNGTTGGGGGATATGGASGGATGGATGSATGGATGPGDVPGEGDGSSPSGCSTASTGSPSSLAFVVGLGVFVAFAARRRRTPR